MQKSSIATLIAVAALAACDDGTGVDAGAHLDLGFATTAASADQASASADFAPETAGDINVSGTNGTLTIEEIWVIVAEFELEGTLGACQPTADDDDDGDVDDDECEEFESPPALVRIPTDGGRVQIVTAAVPLGTYTELEWEVEDVELDDDDEDAQELQAVLDDIQAAFGAGVWPAEASMAVTGTFLADGETTPTAFTTFFDAEIEVEMDLDPALVLTEEGASRELTVLLAPDVWFTNADGTVVDLASLSDELVEFEAEFEDGVIEIERDDD